MVESDRFVSSSLAMRECRPCLGSVRMLSRSPRLDHLGDALIRDVLRPDLALVLHFDRSPETPLGWSGQLSVCHDDPHAIRSPLSLADIATMAKKPAEVEDPAWNMTVVCYISDSYSLVLLVAHRAIDARESL
jgi:hypothetical protein